MKFFQAKVNKIPTRPDGESSLRCIIKHFACKPRQYWTFCECYLDMMQLIRPPSQPYTS